jgi:hypothetical protein
LFVLQTKQRNRTDKNINTPMMMVATVHQEKNEKKSQPARVNFNKIEGRKDL